MPQRSYRWLLASLAAFGLAADLAGKYVAFKTLYTPDALRGESDVAPGWFKFTAEFDPRTRPDEGVLGALQTWSAPVMPRVNHGALFGLGNEHKATSNLFFAAVSLLAAGGIVAWSTRKSTAQDRWLCLALGLILSGTLGNFYDRIVFHGVRDFLYFYKIEWPVFNIADCCLVVGAAVLVAHAFLSPKPAAVEEVAGPAEKPV